MGKGGGIALGRYDVSERDPSCMVCGWREGWHRDPESIPPLASDDRREELMAVVGGHAFNCFCRYGRTTATRELGARACTSIVLTGRMCRAHTQHDEWVDVPGEDMPTRKSAL